MRKVLTVARTEFASAVRTKAFIASLLMLPVIYSIMIFVQIFASKADTQPRKFVVIDRSGKLYSAIEKAAEAHNKEARTADGKLKTSEFFPSEDKEGGRSADEASLALSDRVRTGEIFAYLEIPAEVVQAEAGGVVKLKYHSNNPNYRDLLAWLEAVVASSARPMRYLAANVDPAIAVKLDRPVMTDNLGLATRGAAAVPVANGPGPGPAPESKPGAFVEAKQYDPVRTIFVPMGLGMIVFIVTMNAGPQLMSVVMEEKISRISEMLLGSVTTFELMLGKLLGNAATAMVTTALYLAAAYGIAHKFGYADAVTAGQIAAMVLFVFVSIFLFGSLYMAVGSACSEMRDAQSLMMPVMMLSVIPMAFMSVVIANPSSPIAVGVSMIPFATPMLMTMRMALSPSPPAWQIVASLFLTILTALACVWASAKIFRTGLLMHGKAPTFRELARWVIAK